MIDETAAGGSWVGLVCTPETFVPADHTQVRWLDADADYPLLREAWATRGHAPTRAESRSWRDRGYEYCALVEAERILAVAAAWRRSTEAWELAAVWTREEARGRGYATAVCACATARILAAGRTATCATRRENAPMLRVAERLGYRRRAAPVIREHLPEGV